MQQFLWEQALPWVAALIVFWRLYRWMGGKNGHPMYARIGVVVGTLALALILNTIQDVLRNMNETGLERFAKTGDGVGGIFGGIALVGVIVTIFLQAEQIRMQQRQSEVQEEQLKIQKEELVETRAELSRTAAAQEEASRALFKQVEYTRLTALLQALPLQIHQELERCSDMIGKNENTDDVLLEDIKNLREYASGHKLHEHGVVLIAKKIASAEKAMALRKVERDALATLMTPMLADDQRME